MFNDKLLGGIAERGRVICGIVIFRAVGDAAVPGAVSVDDPGVVVIVNGFGAFCLRLAAGAGARAAASTYRTVVGVALTVFTRAKICARGGGALVNAVVAAIVIVVPATRATIDARANIAAVSAATELPRSPGCRSPAS